LIPAWSKPPACSAPAVKKPSGGLPLLSIRGIVAGAALVFLEVMRELPATLILSPLDFETLATYLWRVYEAGYFGQAAIPGLLLVVISGVAMAVMFYGESWNQTDVFEDVSHS